MGCACSRSVDASSAAGSTSKSPSTPVNAASSFVDATTSPAAPPALASSFVDATTSPVAPPALASSTRDVELLPLEGDEDPRSEEHKKQNKHEEHKIDEQGKQDHKKDDLHHTFSQDGLSISFLLQFVKEHALSKDATTTDVCMSIVKPATSSLNSSYSGMLVKNNACDEQGKSVVGKATHFISHAWKYKFVDLIDAIVSFHYLQPAEVQKTAFYWVDLFVVDQNNSPSLPHSWWSTTFLDAIRAFGNTVLVLSPWSAPVVLTRAWCLWEIYCTLHTHSKLHFALPMSEIPSYREALRNDVGGLIASLTSLDAERADAFKQDDKEMIFQAIREHVGFDDLNHRSQAALLAIVLNGACRDVIKSSENEENLDSVKRILDAGADINMEVLLVTPLGAACDANRPHLVKLLIDRGADVNAIMGNKQTALHLACREGLLEAVQLLISHGANVKAINTAGRTPCQEAEAQTSDDVMQASATVDSDALVAKAREQLNALGMKDIAQLKSFQRPPVFLAEVVRLLCLILKIKGDDTWMAAKAQLFNNPSFLSNLMDYDFQHTQLSNDVLSQIDASLAKPDFTISKMENINNVGAAFLWWVYAVRASFAAQTGQQPWLPQIDGLALATPPHVLQKRDRCTAVVQYLHSQGMH